MAMDELSKTYTLTRSADGWHVNFSTGIAPGFGVEPHYHLFDVIDRVETLYPEYRPRLTIKQLADYQLQVARRGYAQELQQIISQASELRDGLVDLTKKLPEIGAGQDREIAEDLAILHHQLSDLRAHVDIARREVGRAKMMGSVERGMGRNGSRYTPVDRLIRGGPQVRGTESRGLGR
jgi:hypothetical protein